jgi:hypothetical protein
MSDCLASLTEELEAVGLEPGSHSVHGLSLEEDRVRYSWDQSFMGHVGLSQGSEIVLEGLRPDTDPSPLMLVFSTDDYPDPVRQDQNRRAFLTRAHAILLCRLHRWEGESNLQISLDQLLLDATEGVSRYLGRARQRALLETTREKLFKPIKDHWVGKEPVVEIVDRDTLQVKKTGSDARERLLQWLETWRPDPTQGPAPPEAQQRLFPAEPG